MLALVVMISIGILILKFKKDLPCLIFPFIFAYPTKLTDQLLYGNAGFDDLFIIFTFVVLLLQRKMDFQSISVKYLLVFLWIIILSELIGFFIFSTNGGLRITVVLKWGVRILSVVVLYSYMINRTNAKRIFVSYLIAITLASITCIASKLDLPWARYFFVLKEGVELINVMHFGSYGGSWNVGITATYILIISGFMLYGNKDKDIKAVSIATVVSTFPALVFSGNRTGLLGLVVTVIIVCFFSKRKLAFLTATCPVLLFFCFYPLTIDRIDYALGKLLADTNNPYLQPLVIDQLDYVLGKTLVQIGGAEGAGRLLSVQTALGQVFGWWTFFFGAGSSMDWLPHNAFLTIILTYGFIGMVWYYCFVRKMILNIKLLVGSKDSFYRFFSIGVFWALIGNTVNGFFADVVVVNFWIFSFLFWAVMLERMVQFHDRGVLDDKCNE